MYAWIWLQHAIVYTSTSYIKIYYYVCTYIHTYMHACMHACIYIYIYVFRLRDCRVPHGHESLSGVPLTAGIALQLSNFAFVYLACLVHCASVFWGPSPV